MAHHHRCPKCGGQLAYTGRDRTVRGGTWYVLVCPKCKHVEDYFRPRRSKAK